MLQKLVTILFLSGDPISINTIAKILNVEVKEVEKNIEDVSRALEEIGLSLLNSRDGLSIVTQSNQAALVEGFWKEELKGELTPAALQVLTLVAYLSSPTREEISYIRGVQSSQSIRTLTVRGLIAREGEKCGLTGEALKHLGVIKVEDLPEYVRINKELKEKLESRSM
ncbi:MAG: condensin subunit ScpB, segregation and condensation protein [Candidatus Nomurabacteria bacterium]|nr:condensin subunit ScpB, segregation and condensation protein [Candidatus Nomurabacteria bacterium]